MYQKIKGIIIKAFVGGDWNVAYRFIGAKKGQYQILKTPEGTWAADPFLYEVEGKHYLFVELCIKKKDKGTIACYQFINGEPIYKGILIESSYHMSYPCVFSYKGEHYMIPETGDNGTINLYKSTLFPEQWDKVAILSSNERYVDTTVFRQNDEFYAVSYRKAAGKWKLDIFELDMETYKLRKIGCREYVNNNGRPAGNFYESDGLIRPAQDCSLKYGEAIILNRVMMNEGKYEEQEISRIRINDIPVPVKANRIHTYNSDSVYEVVDLYAEKLDLLHGARTFWRVYMGKHLQG